MYLNYILTVANIATGIEIKVPASTEGGNFTYSLLPLLPCRHKAMSQRKFFTWNQRKDWRRCRMPCVSAGATRLPTMTVGPTWDSTSRRVPQSSGSSSHHWSLLGWTALWNNLPTSRSVWWGSKEHKVRDPFGAKLHESGG